MNELPSLFTPARTRAEPAAQAPAAERRAPEATGTDFARSLASVRGLERRAAGLERSVQARTAERGAAPADERERRAADEPAPAVRARAQVQALILSGAMKFAATRSSDAAVTVPGAQAPLVDAAAVNATAVDVAALMPAIAVPPGGDAVSDTPMPRGMVRTVDALPQGERAAPAAQPALPTAIAASAIAQWSPSTMATALDEPVDAAHSWFIETASPELTASAAATVAAMQLVATLPMSDAPAFDDEAPRLPTPSTAGNNDDAARAAWTRRMDALQSAAETSLLVEDHFDAPAIATVTPVAMTTTASTLREVVPVQVTITVVDAATAATTATPAAVHASTQAIERDATQLAPEFRDRLQRVVERMKQEFGHDVTIVETVRSTARQAALFAQGRTTPGPVVTWTRNSRHSKGLAADLMVDGQWENPAGYTHLAQIARQEGLRTLGARDPGHVELPTEGSVSAETLGTLLGDLAGEAGDTERTMRAQVDVSGRESSANAMARVSDVAQVARVSQVARVATVARAGEANARSEHGGADTVSPLAVSAPIPQYMTDGTSVARVAVPVNNVNMADRISHLMDLQASQNARPLNSVLLRMDNANGIEDQIRIDTRGTNVDARLGLGTAQQAADLNSRVGELRDALERRGLTADGLRVQAAPRATDSVHVSRMPAPAIDVAAMRAGADAQAQAQGNPRDQAARDQQHREAMARAQERSHPRSSSDDARHRSRREQPETRQ